MKRVIRQILYSPRVAKIIAKILIRIHQGIYMRLGSFLSAAEGGLHPKHRLINYHQFFLNHIIEGESILDVGCGNGALLRDVALKTKNLTVGVELARDNVVSAKARVSDLKNVEVIEADIWKYEDDRPFDVIILSNVLEHLDKRPELLLSLNKKFGPKRFLIRVPMFERDWLVPYKKELGIEWRLDSTHRIEYTEEEFRDELKKAGLDIQKIIFRWGEMYAVAVPIDVKE